MPGLDPGLGQLPRFRAEVCPFVGVVGAFDTKQSSAVLIQLFASADIPHGEQVTWPPLAPGIKLDRVYSLGLRLIFDWRVYF